MGSKRLEISSVDRISNLPDSLLVKIISLLPFESAVCTSVLSKRWRPLCISLSNLHFHDSFGKISGPHFMISVDTFLMHREISLDIQEFGLECTGDYDTTRVNQWILKALEHGVKCVSLNFCFRDGLYELIPDVYAYGRFEVLRLKRRILVHLPNDYDFCFSRLKVLEFCYVTFSTYESVEELLVNCPVLEDLVIKKCKWLRGRYLTVCGSKLKNLILKCNEVKSKTYLEIGIDTPALETLKLTDCTWADIFIDNTLESLRTAKISVGNVQLELGESEYELFKNIYHVECLTLTDKTIDALRNYDLPTFHNLIKLELRVDNWSCWDLLPEILARSPNLQSLLLPWGVDIIDTSQGQGYYYSLWRMPEFVPECLSSHLRTIEFGAFYGTDDELSLVQYLLLHGRALRKISIYCSERKRRIRKELLSLGGISKTCKIDFIN